jgi:hypothetical protein
VPLLVSFHFKMNYSGNWPYETCGIAKPAGVMEDIFVYHNRLFSIAYRLFLENAGVACGRFYGDGR